MSRLIRQQTYQTTDRSDNRLIRQQTDQTTRSDTSISYLSKT